MKDLKTEFTEKNNQNTNRKMKYHIIRISSENEIYLTDYLRNEKYGIWSSNPEDWRDFSKKQAKDITHRLKQSGTTVRIEKDLGI
ncbi:hypothetical protein AUJ62_00675 [Candidatus Pacearchaeota archaeon CG1_02_32_21]|nr:MAG: hypothetical protein AUJ62_00675 [Candidatus Pacearchaeota archaeon CG1_02_32_21]